jgi:ribosome-associated heat shock protein Hsp15
VASSVRVDKWLWAVRVFKSRSISNDACTSGRVRVNGVVAKPATKIVAGDALEIRRRDRIVILEVEQVLEKRVSAELAAKAYIDSSPPLPENNDPRATFEAAAGRRERGSGRPTKRDRRLLEKWQKQ